MRTTIFEAVDRHYPAIISTSLIALVGGAITVAAELNLNAGEFLGLVALAIGVIFAIDCAHRAAWGRRRQEVAWQQRLSRIRDGKAWVP